MVTTLHPHDRLDIYRTRIFDKMDTELTTPLKTINIGVPVNDTGYNVCRIARRDHGWPRNAPASRNGEKSFAIYHADMVMYVDFKEVR